MRTLLLVVAWSALVCIALLTLLPIGMRPIVTRDPSYERFLAYALLGIMFSVAYPRRLLTVLTIVIGAALTFEALQHLTASRHGEWPDLIEKASGGLFGIAISAVALRYLPRAFNK